MAEYRRSRYLANLFHHIKPGFLRGQKLASYANKRDGDVRLSNYFSYLNRYHFIVVVFQS